jgi:cytochrome c oxidase subunit 2
VRITARDVLHNFYLPHFRVKMDAVPGMPTYFVFTPEVTTEQYRENLKEYEEYQVPADLEDPEGPQKWEVFNYELACAELCGKGHFSMKRIVKIVERDVYDEWLKEQQPYYMTSIRNTDADPFKGQKLASDSPAEEVPAEEVSEDADIVAMNAESAE